MKNENYKIPLVLGITGHRDIKKEHVCTLEESISTIYKCLIDKYPNTPIVLLTPLADGADRIVAKVAFQFEFKDKITVSVPLPMDETSYKDTFGKGLESNETTEVESIDEYNALLKKVNKQENEYIPKKIPMLFNQELYENLKEISDNDINENFYTQLSSKYKKLPFTLKEANDIKKENQKLSEFIRQQIRREQYTIVGEYIAIHSNILLALYDDDSEVKEGGTKEIVRKKLTGEYDHFSISDEDVTYPEDGIVYSVATPKGNNSNYKAFEIKKLFPDNKEEVFSCEKIENKFNIIESIKDYFLKSCLSYNMRNNTNIYTQHHAKIECFNKDVDGNIKNIEDGYENDITIQVIHEKDGEKKKKKYQNKYKKILEKDSDEMKLLKKNLMIRRSAAYLSGYFYQPLMDQLEKYILILIWMTVFIVAFKSDFQHFEYSKLLNPVYILLIGIFYILYLKFQGLKEKQEDYRAISEGLRIHTAWNMVNINDSAALYYLSHQKNELGWIRTALRGINIFYIPKDEKDTISTDLVYNYWIEEQIDYFSDKVEKYEKQEIEISEKTSKYFRLFVIFSILFVLIDFLYSKDQKDIVLLGLDWIDLLKVFLVGLPLTMATYYKSKQLFDGHNDILKEYTLSLDIFNRAKKLEKDNFKNKQNIYKNLGIEALRENSSWIVTRREKKYDTH